MVDLKEACAAAATAAARQHAIGLVYVSNDEARQPKGISSAIVVRLGEEHFLFTAGHNLDPDDLESHRLDIISPTAGRVRLEMLGGTAVHTESFDAAALKVSGRDGVNLDDIALPGRRVWPMRPDAEDLAGGYLTVSGFPGASFQQTGPSSLLIGGSALMSVRAGCDDSPPCPLAAAPWTVDVWIGADGFANVENILDARQAPDLGGVSGGPYWWNSEARLEPGLIAIHLLIFTT